MLAWISLVVSALAAPPLELKVESGVTEVVLKCANGTFRAPVSNGVATFAQSPSNCAIEFIEPLPGRLTQPGVYNCSAAGGCSLADIQHKAVSNAAGRVNVILTGVDSQWLELKCPSGYLARGDIEENTVVFNGAPNEECQLLFKGGTPANYRPVVTGNTYRCSLSGTTAVCTVTKP